jgi:hypothetical protein
MCRRRRLGGQVLHGACGEATLAALVRTTDGAIPARDPGKYTVRNPLQRAYLKSSEPFREVVDARFGSVDERLMLLHGSVEDLTRDAADSQEFMRALAAQLGAEIQRLTDAWTVPEDILRGAQQDAEARGLDGLSAPVADLVNFAASHRGFSAEAGLWVNEPLILQHSSGSVRLAQVNSRIVEIPFCAQAVGALSPGGRVVDVGASESTLVLSLASLGYAAVAVDPRGYPFPHAGLGVHEGTLDDFAPEGPVDAIIFLSSIEHFGLPAYALGDLVTPDADHRALARSRELLAPGGLLVLTVPYGEAGVTDFERTYDESTLAALLAGWDDVSVEIAVRHSDVEWGLAHDARVAAGQEAVALVTARAPG